MATTSPSYSTVVNSFKILDSITKLRILDLTPDTPSEHTKPKDRIEDSRTKSLFRALNTCSIATVMELEKLELP